MAREISKAAAEREAAKAKLEMNDLKDRDSYTAKQVAIRCGTDAKTLRKFLRSSHSTAEAVGQGGRYEFDADDLPLIREEFSTWRKKAEARKTAGTAAEKETIPIPLSEVEPNDEMKLPSGEEIDPTPDDDRDPTPEELKELEDLNLEDLDIEDD